MATIYYVAPAALGGNNSNPGTSVAAPFLTIAHALPLLAAGDTLLIRGGVYQESLTNPTLASGSSWSNTIRIAAYPGSAPFESVTLRPSGVNYVMLLDGDYSYIEFDGINWDATNTIAGNIFLGALGPNPLPHHIRIQHGTVIEVPGHGYAGAIQLGAHKAVGALGGHEIRYMTIHGGGIDGGCGPQCSSYAVYVDSTNCLVENCIGYDTSAGFVQIYNGAGDSPDNNIIRNNKFYGLSRSGLGGAFGILISGDGNKVYNNLFYGITFLGTNINNGITTYNASNTKIWNNTIADCSFCIGVNVDSGSSNTEITNNIVYNVGGATFSNAGTSTTHATNTFDIGDPDPQFTDSVNGDYSLKYTSPCIDTGTDLSGSGLTTDINGLARPSGAYDMGAYEFGGTAVSTIQLVNRGAPGGNTTTSATTIASSATSITAGNLLVLFVYGDDPSTLSTVADTAGNTFTLAKRLHTVGANVIELWYAYNCLGHASNIATATFDNANSYRAIRQIQFSGLGMSDPLEDADSGSGPSGGPLSTPALTASASASVIVAFGAFFVPVDTWIPGTGYNLSSWGAGDGSDPFFDEFKVVTTGEAPTADHSGTRDWVMVSAAFGVTTGTSTAYLTALEAGLNDGLDGGFAA